MSTTYTADDWDFYECEIDHRTVMITVNLSAMRRAPALDEPWLLRLSARALTLGSGASSAEPALSQLQSAVVAVLTEGHSCEFVGSIHSCAAQELYFYSASKPGSERIAEKVRPLFPQCGIEYRVVRDSQWTQYREVLYPAEIEMLQIRNRRVLRQLEMRGDHHAVARPVDHDLYFRTADASAGFIVAAGKSGFRARFAPQLRVPGRVARSYFVNLVRSDPVTPDHICRVALELLVLAGRFDGEYDGWGCDACTPGSESEQPPLAGPGMPLRWSARPTPEEGESDSGIHADRTRGVFQMGNPGFRRNAFRALLVLHFVGLTLVIGIRFANFGIELATTNGSLQSLTWGRDLMGILARSLTLPGFLLTIATGIGLVIVRYGKRVPRWVWAKVARSTVALAIAAIFVGPALEAARKWAHWSVEHGRLAPQFQDSLAQVSLYGGIVFALILLTIPVAVWKPVLASGMRKPVTGKPITK